MAGITDALNAAAAAHPIPGFVAMATADGALIHESAHGQRDADAPMTPDAVFQIYSMTKAVTTAALLQLVERGAVSLDDRAARYAPEIENIGVLTGFDERGAPLTRAPKTPVTVRHLITHTSGLGYPMWNADLSKYSAWLGGARPDANMLLTLPLTFDPGEKWEYGVGIDWAGAIVENVSGKRLDAYFNDHIFAPLGMDSTGFWATPSMATRLAGANRRDEAGAVLALPRGPLAEPAFFSGGGGLLGTAGDYLKFASAIAGDGATILKPETVDLMTRCGADAPRPRKLKTTAPFITNDLDIWGDSAALWSLAFLVNTEPGPHGRSAGSNAWAGLNNTYYWIDRKRRVAGVFMTQLLPFADKDVLAVFGEFERAVYKELA